MKGEGSYKAAKGVIRVKARVKSGKLRNIQIAGDFFMYPEDGLWDLERSLVGTRATRDTILSTVKAFYERANLITPGVTPEDFTEAIVRALDTTEPQ